MSKFEKLVINLSISDIFFLVEVITYIILKELDTELDIEYKYACLSVTNLTAGTYIFSLFQCFLICLERLNATFAVEINTIRRITSNKGIAIGCIACHIGSVLQTVVDFLFQTNLPTCNTSDSTAKLALVIPMTLLCSCTVLIYLVTMVRVYRRQNNQPASSNSTLVEQMTTKALKTLSVVVLITLIANIPSCIIAFYSEIFGRTENITRWIFYCKYLIMINPLLDPIIYAFRLQEFRQQISKVICSKTDRPTEPRSESRNVTFDISI
ncbi:ADORA2B [Mytilus edulis]|uniref:ADORA2B n=1 Tax=Mytilus edulis TaxID=6550 RepID=A0A8S3T145_MYTED|nr:ADORA2B [Mytilus edulis]